MVKNNRYNPTNKKFKDKFQGLAGTKTKKGHLTKQDRDEDDVVFDSGQLVKIEKAKILTNGWIVEVSGNTYHCSNDSSIIEIPDYTETKQYYIPKSKTTVDVSFDKQSNIYKVLRLKALTKNYISSKDGVVTITNPFNKASALPANLVTPKSKSTTTQSEDSVDGIKIKDTTLDLSSVRVGLTGSQIEILGDKKKDDTADSSVKLQGDQLGLQGNNNIDISVPQKPDDKKTPDSNKTPDNTISITGENIVFSADNLRLNDIKVEDLQDGIKAIKSKAVTGPGLQMEVVHTEVDQKKIDVKFDNEYKQMPSVNITTEQPCFSNYSCDFKKKDEKFVGVTISLNDFTVPKNSKISNITIIGS